MPGVTVTSDVGVESRRERRRERRTELVGRRAGALRVEVPDRDRAPTGEERPRRRPAVHARPDHGDGLGVVAPERLGGEHGGGAGAERRHGTGVEHGLQLRRSRRSRAAPAPSTVGSPRAGFPGNDVTHFSSACPPPSAGIARKSPAG